MITENLAISDINGNANLHNNPLNDGGNSLNEFEYDDLNIEKVNCVTIDDYMMKNKIEKINLIKIDVEGHQLNVMKGAKKMLCTFKPKIIVEVNTEIERQEIIDFSKEIGYKNFISIDNYNLYINF